MGLVIGIAIIALAPLPEDDPLEQQKLSKQYEGSMERIGGKSAVMGAEINDFLASLFHGARLGYTVGITSLLVAALYLRWTGADPDASAPRSSSGSSQR